MLHFFSFKAVIISLARLLLLLIPGDRVIPVKATMVEKLPARAIVAMRWIIVMQTESEYDGTGSKNDVSSNVLYASLGAFRIRVVFLSFSIWLTSGRWMKQVQFEDVSMRMIQVATSIRHPPQLQ
jgi:hypothetical protein